MAEQKRPTGRPVPNRYKVPLKQWRKWSPLAQHVFNQVMEDMRPAQQWAFLHPKATKMPREHWETTRWNAAWTAACAANGEPKLGKVVTG